MPHTFYRFLYLLPALLFAAPADATTRLVPSQFLTIQAGIDAAAVSDTVLVAPGTFTGAGNFNIDFNGQDIVLLSEAGPEVTIVDAQGSMAVPRRVFKISTPLTNAARIDGFMIRGGYSFGTTFPRGGGGIWCQSASPTIANCIISDNYGDAGGTGVGGGILLIQSASRILECVISNNEVDPGGGGGLGILNSPLVEVIGCSIINNDFGGAYLSNSTVVFESCTIAGNLDAGAISLASGGSATLENCIVWGNCPGLYAYHPTSSVELTCCVADSSGSGGAGTIIYGENNVFSSDPLFCDATPCAGRAAGATDYHVLVSSPALPENNPCGVLIGALGSCEATSVPMSPTLPDDAIWASPNPFSTSTALSLTTAPNHNATLAVFDITGRQVRRLRLGGSATPVTWDGTDENGGRVAPGTYLLRVDGRRSAAGRVTIVR